MEKNKSLLQRLVEYFGAQKKTTKSEPNVPLEYINAVTKLARKRKDQRFLNDGNNFAKLVAWLMISSVRPMDEILIYSKALTQPFYSTILRASCLLDSKPVFRVVLDDKEGIEVIKKLPEDVQSRIDCRLAATPEGSHMLLTPVAFRAEAKSCHDELFVICNFYEPEVVQALKTRFERIWANSAPCQVI
ncbi:MAG: hypothetical protein UU88_C0019G0003 [Parcubacteria group bacterium GW2011_GWC1_42_11]|uniref:Uncharacterized protein n=1 Tax=Candidatus Nomurabacteria bacterium GW2011_GWC2_42_20 TaxID=1618756 RepID=A0A0G0ZF09_9BACT|nr:MAG: hypothetical protein UU88_C0019G0003 [Parcubacteria group bacterium GW2011_GWC1_42_11]KKS47264.1 MAG: hypothetical protein UV12_C0009G0003 [Candidatus Nomurabacteria bacterium GW2011_GWC2_42_20]KKS58106.1 MAG: hypothetical protein UV24_C0031G0001 [Candidatus Nomurabacteria bacterium GW2011_GWA2_42_41]TAN36591.1 MAG: hypothetical protein EPN27_01065 [Patescibacteria group bacterium]HBH71244.1 hypothetical protein [Candidatus Yonathbacteria bacterium]